MSRQITRLQRTCKICTCSDLMPCDDRGVRCHWVTANLCSACAREHCPSIFGHTLDNHQRQGIANAAIREYKRVRARALKEARANLILTLPGAHPRTCGFTSPATAPCNTPGQCCTALTSPVLQRLCRQPRSSVGPPTRPTQLELELQPSKEAS